MNYGYAPLGKKADKVLAKRLTNLVSELPPGNGRLRPHIEINELYRGVRVRKLTDLTHDQLEAFIKAADKIHEAVCAELKITV